jgi:hypothetical protein
MESLDRRMRPRQLPLRVAGVPISGAAHDNGQPVCCIHSTGNTSSSAGNVTPSGYRPASIASTISDVGQSRVLAVRLETFRWARHLRYSNHRFDPIGADGGQAESIFAEGEVA